MNLLIILALTSLAFCPAPSQGTVETSSDNASDKCPENYGYINGECVKKFVLPERKECPEPDLKFGQFELALGGRVVNYWCEDGWHLVPEDFSNAVCKLGDWSKPSPQCVRPGCEDLKPPHSGSLSYSLDGALVTFECGHELIIEGQPILGCDGQYWNASVPQCVMPRTSGASFAVHNVNLLALGSLYSLMHSK